MSTASPKAFSRIPHTAKRRYVAGVDPGVSTGVALYDRTKGEVTHVKTTDFFGVIPYLMERVRIADLMVFVEVPGMAFYRGNDNSEAAGAGAQRDGFMARCGSNRREAQLLAETLRRNGFEVREVTPVRQKKWDVYEFQAITKIKQTTSQHERDAARLAMHYANQQF